MLRAVGLINRAGKGQMKGMKGMTKKTKKRIESTMLKPSIGRKETFRAKRKRVALGERVASTA